MKSIRNFDAASQEPNNNEQTPADKYDGLSQDELMTELMRTAAAAKSDGSFSAVQLDEFVEFVSPSLDAASKKRLNDLVSILKNS